MPILIIALVAIAITLVIIRLIAFIKIKDFFQEIKEEIEDVEDIFKTESESNK